MTARRQPGPGQQDITGAEVPPQDDFDTWLNKIRPAFMAAAVSGRTFTCYEVADENHLPEPPNPRAHWGRAMELLAADGYIRTAGWAASERPTTRHSGVRTWRGTRAAQQGRAA
ncbi:hypothetical protein [Streptomyces sp. 184]|uniref:hypothetical protein n=1 Tax=Streptomyces sp. 184 TaxID=1827526 RepID=UPI003891ADF8